MIYELKVNYQLTHVKELTKEEYYIRNFQKSSEVST